MPLDPFFSERLRVHRRYLIRQRVDAFRPRLAAWRSLLGWSRSASAEATVPSQPVRRQPAGTERSRARAKHRRAALAWDRKELQTVGTAGPDVRITEHEVLVAGLSIRPRAHLPPDVSSAEPVPAWLTFFGGAFRIGGIDYPTTDAANRRRAVDAGVAMVAVDYALAPEHRFPTQIEQAHAALLWLLRHAAELGIDPGRLGVAGTSAGASIAAALTIANRDRTPVPLRLQLLEVPVTDLTGRHLDLRATRALGIPSIIALRELRSVAHAPILRTHPTRRTRWPLRCGRTRTPGFPRR